MTPKTIPLSKAVWLTAFPDGPSESDRLVALMETRNRIEKMLPDAALEWQALGRDPTDLDKFKASVFRLANGYKGMQQHISDWPPKVRALMALVAEQIARDDETSRRLDQAHTDLNEAAHDGFVKFEGAKEGVAGPHELPRIPSSYFRFERIFLCSLRDVNEITSDPSDDRQRGQKGYSQVVAVFKSFRKWMLATNRWQNVAERSEKSETKDLERSSGKNKTDLLPKLRGGAPQTYEWHLIEPRAVEEMKKRGGGPDRDGPKGWRHLSNFETIIADFCDRRWGCHPASTTLRPKLKSWIQIFEREFAETDEN